MAKIKYRSNGSVVELLDTEALEADVASSKANWETVASADYSGWMVRKWPDGSCVAVATTRLAARNAGTAWGSGFFVECYGVSLPPVFSSVHAVHVTPGSAKLFQVCGMKSLSTTTYVPYLSSFAAFEADVDLPVFITVEGMWK